MYKYFAFISYNSKDTAWGIEWCRKALSNEDADDEVKNLAREVLQRLGAE